MELVVTNASRRSFYGYEDWKQYLRDSADQGKDFTTYNEDYFKYLRGVERVRELTDSESYYMRAYDEVVNGVKI